MRVIKSSDLMMILSKLNRQNQIGRSVSTKVYELWNELVEANSFEDVEVAFGRLNVTNHGETRIQHCVKYDLGKGYRLVTIKHKGVVSLEFVGNHDDTDKWLNANAGKQLITDGDTITSVKKIEGEKYIGWMDNQYAFPMNSDKPLLDFLREKDHNFIDTLNIPIPNYRSLLSIYSYSSKDELEAALNGLPEREYSFLSSLFNYLYQDDLEGAFRLIEHEQDEFFNVSDLNSSDINNVRLGRGYIELRDLSKEEWNSLLDSEWVDWMLFLHPDQKEIVNKDFNGPSRLLGVSGSGKTCVLVHRALYLAKKYKEPVLITTINHSLAELLKGLVDQLIELEFQEKEILKGLIQVKSFWKVCFDFILQFEKDSLIRRGLEEYSDKSQDDVDRIWEEFVNLEENNDDYIKAFDVITALKGRSMDAHTYIKDEFNLVRSATSVEQRLEYLDLPRTGRKTPLNKELREVVLSTLNAWEEKMEHVGVSDYMNVLRFVNKHESNITTNYRSILIDEIQDFGTEELRILRKLVDEDENDIFMCGDIAQQVQVKQHKIRTAGINVLPSNYLKIVKNYRNSREILLAANSMFNSNINRDDFTEEGFELLDPELANFHTTEPYVYYAPSFEMELEYALNYLRWCLNEGLMSKACIALAGFSHFEVCRLAEQLQLPILNGDTDVKDEKIVISELNQTKGFEFDVVAILNLNSETFPKPNYPKEEEFRDISRLYVAMTRAKKELILSYNTTLSKVFNHVGEYISDPTLWSEQLGEEINEVQLDHFSALKSDNLMNSELDGLRFIIRTPLLFSRDLALKFKQLVTGRSTSDTSGRPTQFKAIKDLRGALKIPRYQGHLRSLFGTTYEEAMKVLEIELEVQRI
ncbi:UvrD-helicase domain-containing protein [Schleiferiaceae bacterium]|nr:UvrD-helicase domain-containing protein [Schleiferiaceae bacterium]